MSLTPVSAGRGEVPALPNVVGALAKDAQFIAAVNGYSSAGYQVACLLTASDGTRFVFTERYPGLLEVPCNGGNAASLAEVGWSGGPKIPAHEIPLTIEGVRESREIRAVRRLRGLIPGMIGFDACKSHQTGRDSKVTITIAAVGADSAGGMQPTISFETYSRAARTVREVFGRDVDFKVGSDPFGVIRSIPQGDMDAFARVCGDVWCDVKRDKGGKIVYQDSKGPPRSKYLQSIVLDLIADRVALIEEGPQSEPRKGAEILVVGSDRLFSVARPELGNSQWRDSVRIALLQRREHSESIVVNARGHELEIVVLTPPSYRDISPVYSAPRHLPFEVRLRSISSDSDTDRVVFEEIPAELGFSGLQFSGDGRSAFVDLNNPGARGLSDRVRRHLEKRIGARVFDPTNRFTQVDAGDPLVARVHQLVSGGAGVRKIWRCDFDGTIRLDTVRPIPQETLESIGKELGCKVTQHNKNAPVPEYWRRAVEMIAKSEPITPTLDVSRQKKMKLLTVHGAAQQVGGSSLELGGGLVFDRGAWLDGPAPKSQPIRRLAKSTRFVIVSHAHADHAGDIIDMWAKNLEADPLHRCQFVMNEATALATWRLLQDRHLLGVDGSCVANIDQLFQSAVRIAPMRHPVALSDSTRLTLFPAGHHIGSCMSLLEHEGSRGRRRVLYTGDLQSSSNYGESRLYPAAEPVGDLDAVIVEGTNGMDAGASREQLEQALLNEIINRAERNHTVVVPVLTAGRAQEVLSLLHRNSERFRRLNIPVFVDGKSIPQVNQLFSYESRCYPELFRPEVLDMPWRIDSSPVRAIPSEQRQRFMDRRDKKVVIVPGGMGVGPAFDWISSVGWHRDSSVVFTCYQAPGTPGYEILHRNDPEENKRNFKWFRDFGWFKGEAVMCRLSGHNSGADTVEFVGRSLKKGGKVVLVHGQSSNLDAIRGALVEQGVAGEVIVAEQGQQLALW